MVHRISNRDIETLQGTCEVCGPVSLVKKNNGQGRYTYRCKQRHMELQRNQKKRAVEDGRWVYDPEKERNRLRKRRWHAQKEELLIQQDSKCAVCAKPIGMEAHLDHDHACCETLYEACGECFRGLLCRTCNVGIGMLGDNPDLLLRAASYLSTKT